MKKQRYDMLRAAARMYAQTFANGTRSVETLTEKTTIEWVKSHKRLFERCKSSTAVLFTRPVNLGSNKYPEMIQAVRVEPITNDTYRTVKETEKSIIIIFRHGRTIINKQTIIGYLTD